MQFSKLGSNVHNAKLKISVISTASTKVPSLFASDSMWVKHTHQPRWLPWLWGPNEDTWAVSGFFCLQAWLLTAAMHYVYICIYESGFRIPGPPLHPQHGMVPPRPPRYPTVLAQNCGETQVLSFRNCSAHCSGRFNAEHMEPWMLQLHCVLHFHGSSAHCTGRINAHDMLLQLLRRST